MKKMVLWNAFSIVLSLCCAFSAQAQEPNTSNEDKSESTPASIFFERHDRGHDPSENGRGAGNPPSNASGNEDGARHDRGHDPIENGRGDRNPPSRPEPPPRHSDEDRCHGHNGRCPEDPAPTVPSPRPQPGRPDRPHRPDPRPHEPAPWPHPDPRPQPEDPLPDDPVPDDPVPVPDQPVDQPPYPPQPPEFPSPVEPAPSYPPPPAPNPVPPGPNWQTRTISFEMGRVVANERIDLMELARLGNFRSWQVVNVRMTTRSPSSRHVQVSMTVDGQWVAGPVGSGRTISLSPQTSLVVDGSFRKLELEIQGSMVVDAIEIEMGAHFQ